MQNWLYYKKQKEQHTTEIYEHNCQIFYFLNDSIDEKKKSLEDKECEMKRKEIEIEKISISLEKFEEKTKNFNESFFEKKNNFENIKNKLSSLKKNFSISKVKEKNFSNILNSLSGEKKRNEKNLKNLENQINDLKNSINSKKIEINENENKNQINEEEKKRITELKNIISLKQKNFEQTLNSFTKYKNKKEKLRNEKLELEKELFQKKEQLREIEIEKQKTKTEKDENSEEKNKIEKQIKKLKEKFENLSNDKPNKMIEIVKKLEKNLGFCKTLNALVFTKKPYLFSLNTVFFSILKNTIVVKTREDANQCIKYFTENKLGVVRVEILDEYKKSEIEKEVKNLTPLINLIEFVDIQDFQLKQSVFHLFNHLTRNWFLFHENNNKNTDPIYYIKKYNNINVVTLEGDIFKSEGEIRTSYSDFFLHKNNGLQIFEEIKHKNLFSFDILEERKKIEKILHENENNLNNITFIFNEINDKFDSLLKKSLFYDTFIKNNSKKLTEIDKEINSIDQFFKQDIFLNCLDLYDELVTLCGRNSYFENQQSSIEELEENLENLETKKQIFLNRSIDISNNFSKNNQSLNEIVLKTDQLKKEIETNENNFENLSKENKILIKQEKNRKIEREKIINNLEYSKENLLSVIGECKSLQNKKIQLENDLLEVENFLKNLENKNKILESQKKPKKTKKTNFGEQEKKIEKTEMILKEIRSKIDKKKIEKYNELTKIQKTVFEFINQQKIFINEKIFSIEQLQNKRFNIFVNSIEKVNDSLSIIYKKFSVNGNCYLSFMKDKVGFFHQGVQFHVKPDKTFYRPLTIFLIQIFYLF